MFQVYVLVDRDFGSAIRYVGLTSTSLVTRLANHLTGYKYAPGLKPWLEKLVYRYKLTDLVEAVSRHETLKEARQAESEYIRKCLSEGRDLFNVLNTPKHGAHISEVMRGRPASPKLREHLQELGRTRRGIPLSSETKRRISEAKKGRKGKPRGPLTKEHRQAIKDAWARRKATGE